MDEYFGSSAARGGFSHHGRVALLGYAQLSPATGPLPSNGNSKRIGSSRWFEDLAENRPTVHPGQDDRLHESCKLVKLFM